MNLLYFTMLTASVSALALLAVSRARLAIVAVVTLGIFVPEALPWEDVGFITPTALRVLSLVAVMVHLLIRRDAEAVPGRFQPKPVLVMALLSVVLAVYALAATNEEYALQKVVLFLVLCVLPAIMFGLMRPFRDVETKVICITILLGSVLAAMHLRIAAPTSIERAAFVDISSITSARSIGVGLAVGLSLVLLSSDIRRRVMLLAVLAVPFALMVTMIGATGSRGPLLAAPAAALGTWILSVTARRLGSMSVGMLLLGGVVMYAASQTTWEAASPGAQRISYDLETLGENSSDAVRLEQWAAAWDGINSSGGLGVGTGDFAGLVGTTGRAYPHNVVLEVWVELGLLGLAVLVWFMYLALAASRQACAAMGPWGGALTAVFLFGFLNSLVSGDLPSNSGMWIGGALVALYASAHATRKRTVENIQADTGVILMTR